MTVTIVMMIRTMPMTTVMCAPGVSMECCNARLDVSCLLFCIMLRWATYSDDCVPVDGSVTGLSEFYMMMMTVIEGMIAFTAMRVVMDDGCGDDDDEGDDVNEGVRDGSGHGYGDDHAGDENTMMMQMPLRMGLQEMQLMTALRPCCRHARVCKTLGACVCAHMCVGLRVCPCM